LVPRTQCARDWILNYTGRQTKKIHRNAFPLADPSIFFGSDGLIVRKIDVTFRFEMA
jgi:hypothetical protein